MNDVIVDIFKDTGQQIIVSQNDNLTKTYKLIITKNNARYDLSNKKVRFAFLKNGTNLGDIVESLTISDAENGVIDFPITSTITRESGTFTCGLAIFNDSGYMENTAFFNMVVKESLFEKISGGLIDEGTYSQVLSLLERGEDLKKKLEPLVDRAEITTPKLEDLVPRAEIIAEPLQKAVEDAESKKPQLDSSIESARAFIENLDGSQNLPQMREDITSLQNGLKANQELAYEGSSIKCEKTFEESVEDVVLEGKTYQNLFEKKNIIGEWKLPFEVIADGQSHQERYSVPKAKPGKEYTIVIKVTENTINNNFSLTGWESTSNQAIITKKDGTGIIKKKIITNAGGFKTEWYLELWRENTEGKIAVDWLIILEGDYLNEEFTDFFEGIQSVGEKEGNKVIISSNDKENRDEVRNKQEIKIPFEGGLKEFGGVKDLIFNKNDGCYALQKIGKRTEVGNGQNDYYQLDDPIETKISDTKLQIQTYNGFTYIFSNNVIAPNIKIKVASNIGSIVQQNSRNINDIYRLLYDVIMPQIVQNTSDIATSKIK